MGPWVLVVTRYYLYTLRCNVLNLLKSSTMKQGVFVAAALAVAAANSGVAKAFVPQVAPWRTTPVTSQRRQHTATKNTCSATDNRRMQQQQLGPRTVRMSAAAAGTSGEGEQDSDATALERRAEEGEGGGEGRQRRWAGLRRSLAIGSASLATFTLGATALSGLSAEVQHRVGGAVSMPAAMLSAKASVWKPFNKRTVGEKLGNLPAFMVTNYKGSPYLTPSGDEGTQMAVFFTNVDDAQEMLFEMVQNSFYSKEARILVVSMEKAYGMVKAGPTSTGFVNDDGVEETMMFKFDRDYSSLIKAARLGLKIDPAARNAAIPVFFAEGLEVKRDGSMVRPFFMDPADLVVAWEKAAKANPDMPEKPDVKVFNFAEVVVQMEISDDLKDFGFFPSSEGKEYIESGRVATKPRPKSRLGRMWGF